MRLNPHTAVSEGPAFGCLSFFNNSLLALIVPALRPTRTLPLL